MLEQSNKIPVPESLSFETPEGRQNNVRIVSSEPISAGAARVQRITVAVGDEGAEKQRIFILKNFRDTVLAEHSMHVHARLSEVGIKTWPTYRIESSRRKSVLMTDGELTDKDKVITSNNLSKSMIEMAGAIDSVDNFENAIDSAIHDALTASRNGIEIGSDAWMAKFHKEDSRRVSARFFIGDLEGVSESESARNDQFDLNMTGKLSQINLLTLGKALKDVLQWTVSGNQLPRYQEMLKTKISSGTSTL